LKTEVEDKNVPNSECQACTKADRQFDLPCQFIYSGTNAGYDEVETAPRKA
jgi:hypothetical protein